MSDLKKQLKESGLIDSFGQPLGSGKLNADFCWFCDTTCQACVDCVGVCVSSVNEGVGCTECVGCVADCTLCTDSVTGC